MKYSRYNYLMPKDGRFILYNTVTDGILVLNDEIADIVEQGKNDVVLIENMHPELYEAMVRFGMIVPQAIDESQEIINRWTAEDTDQTAFFLTVYPTMDCNLRCWYCYEKHEAGTDMGADVLRRTLTLIDNKVSSGVLRYLSISFFGGEPMMRFNEVMLPIMTHAWNVCKANNVHLHIDATTNGVFLTREVCDKILALNLVEPISFQITIDGNRQEHDKSRHTATGGRTFDAIIRNIKSALSTGFGVNVRFNYTQKSVDSFIDLIDEFIGLPENEKRLLFFDFQQVWQESAYGEVRKKAMGLADIFRKQGFQVRIEKRFNKERCKSDAENQAVINFDGMTYKCTAYCFKKENAEGCLLADGYIAWNERYEERMSGKYGNNNCWSCSIFPICHGGCSQTKIGQSGVVRTCLFDYSKEDKERIVAGRLNYILKTGKANY